MYHYSCHQEFLFVGHGLPRPFLLSSETISLCFIYPSPIHDITKEKHEHSSFWKHNNFILFSIWSFWEEPEGSHCHSGNVCHPSLTSEQLEKLELYPEPESSSECPELKLALILVYIRPHPHGANTGEISGKPWNLSQSSNIFFKGGLQGHDYFTHYLLNWYWLKNLGSLHQVLC